VQLPCGADPHQELTQWQGQPNAAEAAKAGAKAASNGGHAHHWQAADRHGQEAESVELCSDTPAHKRGIELM